MAQVWAGMDIGKTHHHCVVLDADGKRLLSRRVANDEPELLALFDDVGALGETVTWAVDVASCTASLLISVLLDRAQHLVYIPGLAVNRASAGYRGMGKTDAKDAAVIADQARMRRDLTVLTAEDDTSVELQLLTSHRSDLVADRTRSINRLRALLTAIFPALEREPDLATVGPLILLTGYQTPRALRGAGATEVRDWLRTRKVRNAASLASLAVAAAGQQHTIVAGETVTAHLVQSLAQDVLSLNSQITEVEKLIEASFKAHELADVITSMPGIGLLLGAEFLAATGGDLSRFGSPERLASLGGVAPVPRDSGRISGNLHRPRRYHRSLQRVFYYSALVSLRNCPESRRFYERKRPKASATSRPSSPSPADESTSCGH